LNRARYAFSAASRSYSAVFKEVDNSHDLIRRRATRVITNTRSKFGLDLHARHSRRVNKSRRTYNGDLDSDPISLPPSAGGSYENSEDKASPLRGGEARTPEFAPEYGPSDTPGVPPGPPRRTFSPEQGHLFSYPISAEPAEGAAPPLVPPISSIPATAPPPYSGLLSPHLRPSTPAPYPPPNPNFRMDSGYDAFHPWYDPNGDLASHASLSSARSELVAAPVPPWLDLGFELGLGPAPPTPVATTPHVPVIATTPHGPVLAAPVLVAAPYGPIPTLPRPASVYAESNASDRTEKSFYAREQVVYDLERKLIIETQKYETLNQEASIRDLRAVHAEQKRLRDVELVNLQAQNNAAANIPQPRQTGFDLHYNQRASTVPPVPATNHSAELQPYFNLLDPTGMAAFGNLNPVPAPLHTPGPVWLNPVTLQTHMPTPGISRKRVPYGRDEPEIESYKTPCPRDPYGKVFHPGDPKDQRNVSTDANSSHWVALFELSAAEHAAVYIDSEDSEWVRLVLSMIKNRSCDKWHSNSIYSRGILTQWLEARTLQRTKGKSKDSTNALNTLEALNFHSNLRAGDDTTKLAEGRATFRLTFIRVITNALTHGCDWMEILACLHVCSRALKTGQQRVRSIVVTAMKDTSLFCNPVLHAMVIVAKLDSSFITGCPWLFQRNTFRRMGSVCLPPARRGRSYPSQPRL